MTGPVFGIVETDLGIAGVAVSNRGITRATLFAKTAEPIVSELAGAGAVAGGGQLLLRSLEALKTYASGAANELDEIPIDLQTGTALQRTIWMALRAIPAGETRTYGRLAQDLGLSPGSARAVGSTLARNPIPVWLPCHRVVGADGGLRGFAGGLDMKSQLLVLEGARPAPLPF